MYNVHLSWPIGTARLPRALTPGALKLLTRFDDGTRNLEVAQLARHLENETLPFIAAGDYNLSQHAVTYNVLAQVADDAFGTVGWGLCNTWRLHPKLPPLLRIDYLWHSADFTTLRAKPGSTLASDHLPLVTQLVLTNAREN